MKKHGLAIGLERTGTTFYLTMKIVGYFTLICHLKETLEIPFE